MAAVHKAWAIGRFEDVRAALRADDVLVSGGGVAMNDLVDGGNGVTTLTSDGELRRRRRGVVMRPMMPSALAEVQAEVERLATTPSRGSLGRGRFDGIADFARRLPVAVVSRLVGLPEAGRERMLDWAKAVFDVLGPDERAGAGRPCAPILEMGEVRDERRARAIRAGGWAAQLVHRGG